jgi:hypothetical protein
MSPKNPAAVSLGRKGGQARAKNLSPQERSEAARKAVEARWAKTEKQMSNSHRELDAAMQKLDRVRSKQKKDKANS